jgi:hypothetical protein
VHTAIVALGCKVVCSQDRSEGRQIGLFLPGGVLGCVFDNAGLLISRLDGLDLLESAFPDLDDQSLADRASETLADFSDEQGVWRGPRGADQNWLRVYIARHRKGG